MGLDISPAASPASVSPLSRIAVLVALTAVVGGVLLTASAEPATPSARRGTPIAVAEPARAVEQAGIGPRHHRMHGATDVDNVTTQVITAAAAGAVVREPAFVPDVAADEPPGGVPGPTVVPLVAGIVIAGLLTMRIRATNARGTGTPTLLAAALALSGTGGFALATASEVLFGSVTGDYLTDAGILALALAALGVAILGFRVMEKVEMAPKRDRAKDEQDRVLRALRRPPEHAAVRAALKWRSLDEPWRVWLQRSGAGVDLFNRWDEHSEHVALLGEDAYREQLVQVLSRVAPRDCAASGFGCTRRSDRRCQAPEICSQDPAADADEAVSREGPLPGGCDHYYGWQGDDPVEVRFSAGNRHRAVEWDGRIWINGALIAHDAISSDRGEWIDDRFFVISGSGFDALPAARSLLVYDADRRSRTVLVPAAPEKWTNPRVVREGDVLLVYPDRTSDTPDRTLPVDR